METKSETTYNLKIWPLPPIIVGLALILCALIVRNTIISVKGLGQTVQVTGAAFKPIMSDFAVWETSIQTTSADVTSGYEKMKRDVDLMKAFLAQSGFDEAVCEIGAIQVNQNFDRERQTTNYNLKQLMKVSLADVPRISKLGQQTSSLLEKGVNLGYQNIRYMYTKLENAKIEMIKAATENAKLRAEQLANTTGRSVGAPTSAKVGVFQIRPLRSQEVSDYGMNDVTSIEKEIVCTVNISFLID